MVSTNQDQPISNEQSVKQNEKLDLLLRIIRLANEEKVEDTLFSNILLSLQEILMMKGVALHLTNFSTNTSKLKYSVGLPQSLENDMSSFSIESGQFALVYQDQKISVFASNIYEGIKSFLIVPLKTNDKMLGTLTLVSEEYLSSNDLDLDFLNGLAAQLGAILNWIFLKDEVHSLNTDLIEQRNERILAELASRQSIENYQRLFEETSISLWDEDYTEVLKYVGLLREQGVVDLQQYFTENKTEIEKLIRMVKIDNVNKATLSMYNAKSKTELLQSLETVLGEDAHYAFLEGVLALARGKTDFELETTNYKLTGEAFHILLKASVFSGTRKGSWRLIVSIIDIDERKRAEIQVKTSEERYRSLFENIPIGLYRTTPTGQIIAANPTLIKMLGFSSFKDISLRNLEQISQEIGYSRKIFHELMEEKEEVKGLEWELTRRDGSTIVINESAKAIKDENNEKILYFEGSCEDITEKKKAGKARKELEQRRADFISMTSHELRTPLQAIQGYIDLFQRKYEVLPEDQREKMFIIVKKNIRRLERLISSVSDLTKIDKGIFEIKRHPIDFYQFIDDIKVSYVNRYPNQIQFVETNRNDSVLILGDIDRLDQALENLIDNAIKSTTIENRSITISAETFPEFVRISVTDNGVGINPENLELIFEQFISIPHQQSVTGTGIGLFIVRKIAELHGGSITAQSEGKGKGATFVLEIPRID